MKRVRAVIVNFRTADLVVECLRSLVGQEAPHFRLEAVVVDNASGDGSVEFLEAVIRRHDWSGWASLRPQPRNGGFAYGTNAGIAWDDQTVQGVDYVMLLNPDAIASDDAVRSLVDLMERFPRIGVAGSAVLNVDGAVECSSHHFPSPLGELEAGARLGVLSRVLSHRAVSAAVRHDAHSCDWVSGASMLVRREVFQQVGLFDEQYFLYFEEVDFCRRAKAAGWEVWWEPASRVRHLEGASTGITDSARPRPPYWFDSRRRYFLKHHGTLGLIAADAMWVLGRSSLAARRFLNLGRGGRREDPPFLTRDIVGGDLRHLLNEAPWQTSSRRRTSATK